MGFSPSFFGISRRYEREGLHAPRNLYVEEALAALSRSTSRDFNFPPFQSDPVQGLADMPLFAVLPHYGASSIVTNPPQSLSRVQRRSFFDEVQSMTVIHLPPREDPAYDGMLEPSDAFTRSK